LESPCQFSREKIEPFAAVREWTKMVFPASHASIFEMDIRETVK
jgi:hypothetical protein